MMALSMTACSSGSTATTAAETKASEAETTTEAASSEAEETTAAAAGTEGGTLIVGFDQDFPPMGFLGDNNEYTGFDLELAQEVAKRLGLEYQAQPNIDCIWNGFTMTGREDDYTWTEPYMENTQVFVVRNDSGIEGKDGLAGKVVECQADSSAEAALKEETAKILMIWWCLFTFITAGFEHSVANMGFLTMGLLLPHGADVTIMGMVHNLLWVSLGNFVGGVLFVGLPYYFITKEKKNS